MDYGQLRDRLMRPERAGQRTELAGDPRRAFVRTVPCTSCDGSGTVTVWWDGCEQWGCSDCDVTGNAKDAPVGADPGTEHVDAIAGCPAFVDAETAARAVAAALAPWGHRPADRITWRVGASSEPRICSSLARILPRAVEDLLDEFFRLRDKEIGIGVREVGLGFPGDGGPSHAFLMRGHAHGHARLAAAARLGLRYPAAGFPDGVAGRPVAEVPNPFTPLLDVWRTGFAPERFDEDGIGLFAPRRVRAMDYLAIRDRMLRPVHTGRPVDLTDDSRRGFLRPVRCQVCGGSGTTMNQWDGAAEEWACGTCGATGVAKGAPVDAEPGRGHVDAIADCPAFRAAEAAARAAAGALVPWGIAVPDRIVWRAGHTTSIALRYSDLPFAVSHPIGLLFTTEWRPTGLSAFIDDPGLGQLGTGPSHVARLRGIASDHARWEQAVQLGRTLPEEGFPAGVGGRPIAELPNPFAPVLAVLRTGFVLDRVDETGMWLYAPHPDTVLS